MEIFDGSEGQSQVGTCAELYGGEPMSPAISC